MKDWFTSWFNSPYYHLLYKDRDEEEAKTFIDAILGHLDPTSSAKILDLACGRGRHAVHIHNKGFNTVGLDISANSIAFAKKLEKENLKFRVGDMRQAYAENEFDLILNLFTSFGYFQDVEDERLALQNAHLALKDQGLLVIDYLNAIKVQEHLVDEEIKQVENIEFHIKREIKDGFIYKHISFMDGTEPYHFKERVRYHVLEDFKLLLKDAGFQLIEYFGDSQLQDFDPKESNRLILIAEKQ